MASNQWYLEYKIHHNRPGLLGDIASLLGMLEVNILTINGLKNQTRCMLLQTTDANKITLLGQLLSAMNSITVNKLGEPSLVDIMAMRHGKYIERNTDELRTYRFTREELGMLVDFLGEAFKQQSNLVIGLRGRPRVGKTESVIAGSVCANKRWTFLSSTLMRQTVRNQLTEQELNPRNVFIIDGVVSTMRSNEKHAALLEQVFAMPSVKVVEHPDIFVSESTYDYHIFDFIVELRSTPDEEITMDELVLDEGYY